MWYVPHLKGHFEKTVQTVFEYKIRIANLACNVKAAYATFSDWEGERDRKRY